MSAATPPPGPAVMSLADARIPPLVGNRAAPWRLAWYVVAACLFDGPLHLPYRWKAGILRLFGARIGTGLVIKPRVRIKYPWFLTVGDHVWLGEGVWIDNLCPVVLGSDVCISQGAYLCTGNHDWRDPGFTRFVRPIAVADQAWIGAMAVICPGVTIGRAAVIAVGAVLFGDALPGMIHRGNPAVPTRPRLAGGS